jgi:hypothetical protein
MTATPSLRIASETRPFVQQMTIDPEQALRWLDTCNTNNRKVSDKHVQRLARDMAEGKWVLTHAGIAFGPDNTLLDGQHRLWAIVESGRTVEMFVWRNVDPETMIAIDCGKMRSMADILNIAGANGEVTNYHLAALRAMLGGFGNPPTLSPSETSEALRVHREAVEFALEQLPVVTSARGVNTAVTRAVVARAWYSVDRTMLKDFCRKLTSGIVTSPEEGVIVLLRQYLQTNRGGSYSVRMQRYGKVERALTAWLKGESPTRLYPAACEQFPLPEEAKG